MDVEIERRTKYCFEKRPLTELFWDQVYTSICLSDILILHEVKPTALKVPSITYLQGSFMKGGFGKEHFVHQRLRLEPQLCNSLSLSQKCRQP